MDADLLERQEAKNKGGREYNPLRPSSAGKCTRELGFEYAEYRGKASYQKEEMSGDTIRLLSLGHAIEWHLLKMLGDVELFEIKYKQQVVSFFKLDADKWIEGSVDAVIWSPKWKAVMDVKSKKDNFSSWASSQWDEHSDKYSRMKSIEQLTDRAFWIPDLEAFLEEVNDPFLASNFYQVNLYANTQFLQERGIDHGVVVQYNKNLSKLRELRFAPSKKVADDTQRKFQRVADTIDGGGTPDSLPRDYSLGSIKCAFCPFKRECRPGAADAKDEYFKTWPKKQWPVRTGRLGDVGSSLERLFSKYRDTENAEKEKARIEQLITLEMEEAQLQKIELEDGSVYEMKNLKTGFAIRKGKK